MAAQSVYISAQLATTTSQLPSLPVVMTTALYNNPRSRQVTWNATEGQKGVVCIVYLQDDFRDLGLCWSTIRDGFDGQVNSQRFMLKGDLPALRHWIG
jgi:hypothetical protein